MTDRAIVFDLDGTLATSDPIHLIVFGQVFAKYGVVVDEALFAAKIHGRQNVDIFADCLGHVPEFQGDDAPAALAALADAKEAKFRDVLRGIAAARAWVRSGDTGGDGAGGDGDGDGGKRVDDADELPPFEATAGARELIAWARESGIKVACCTNAPRANAETMLSALGMEFETLIIGDECEAGKPHPAPYLAAAAALGVPPSACVVFEDSVTGVRSAVAAGVRRVVGIRGAVGDEALHAAGVDAMVPDFTAVDRAALFVTTA